MSSPRCTQVSCVAGAKPPSSRSEQRERVGRGYSAVIGLCPLHGMLFGPLQLKIVARRSPRLRWCSRATRSAYHRVWSSVQQVGVRHSDPPVKRTRLRSLDPLCPRWMHVPTQNQEALSAPSEGRGGPSAGGRGSSQRRRGVKSDGDRPFDVVLRLLWQFLVGVGALLGSFHHVAVDGTDRAR